MKFTKSLAAFAAILAMLVWMVPFAAFAADGPNGAKISSYASYQIGTLDSAKTGSDQFTSATSVAANTSGLVLRVFFSGTAPSKSDRADIIVKNCNFIGQTCYAQFYENQLFFDVMGLKYNNATGRIFTANLVGYEDFSFSISECEVAAASSDPTKPTPAPASAPGLIVKSSSIGTDSVNAGDAFTLTLTIYATTSGTTSVNDVVVAVTPDKGVAITSGSSTQYIGTLQPGGSQTVSFPMRAQADFTDGVSVIAVSVTGTGADGTGALSSSTNISVPVLQADRFEISNVEVPSSIMVGESATATLTFVNKGKNPVGNLSFSLACDNIQEGAQNQYVGNLAAGTQDSVDFDLQPLAAGPLSGTVTITYEAPGGKTVTLTQQISSTVEATAIDSGMTSGSMVDPTVNPDVTPASGMPKWAVLLIGAAVAAAVVAIVVVIRRKKAKKARLEAEDEDL